MRICFIGKYPPIEGGVSAQTYWAVRGLAERGHEVFVVTNADEVEQPFRILLGPRDAALLEPEFPSGGFVRVFRPEPYSVRMGHIPASNPFVSKLAGVALRVVADFGCEVVVGYYYEPYGLAASLTASWTGTSLLLQHAGSDLDRLMRLPELASVYKRMLRAADGVITRPGLAGRFLGMGVRPDALRTVPRYAVPAPFGPDAPALQAAEIERIAFGPPDASRPDKAFDPGVPTIGMYGKPGEVKGTYDLIAALGMLRAAGLEFNLLLLSGGWQQRQVCAALTESRLEDRTWMLPFLPHWRVPSFIRACTAVCFLERDFPIAIHGPVVAREVLACGTCLVLSGEIHGKQPGRDQLIDGDNLILVPDPKDRDSLAKRLRTIVEDPASAIEIGSRGRMAALESPDFEDYIGAWEDLVNSVRPGAPGLGHSILDTRSGPVAERLAGAMPWVKPLLGDRFGELVRQFCAAEGDRLPDGGDTDPVLSARFCDFLAASTTGCVRDAARYQRARLWTMWDDEPESTVPLAGIAFSDPRPAPEAMRELYPFRSVPMRIEQFDHDVTPVLCVPDGPQAVDPASVADQPLLVCFARMPNLAPAELRLNAASARLLDHCDGGRRAGQLAASMAADLARTSATDASEIERQACAVLARFHRAGVVRFAERPVPSVALSCGSGHRPS